MSNLNERKVISAILGSALQVPGAGTFGPRLVASPDALHSQCQMSIVTNNGTDYLLTAYKGKEMAIPMSFVAMVEFAKQ